MFAYKWLGPYTVCDISQSGLCTMINQKGKTLKKKYNVALLKLYIQNDDPQHEKPAAVSVHDGKPVAVAVGVHDERPAAVVAVHDEKPATVGVHDEKTPAADGVFNLWETLPDEIVERILLTAIKSSGYTFPNHVCDTYHAILGNAKDFVQ